MEVRKVNTLVIGSGAAGLCAALRLQALGVKDSLLVTEGVHMGTSINTGSDKQTYYKLGLYGKEPDSLYDLASSLFEPGAVHGDLALTEAALSVRCFHHLVDLGVPFPCDGFGQYIGYKTDHDPRRRATSCGPYTSREMCLALLDALKKTGMEILEKRTLAELVKVDGRCGGALFLNGEDKNSFSCILAENTVFAVGGPGGLYQASVYPACHTGAIGAALKIGAKARNLPESQFGLASIRFRWNVSGTYMQVLPRFLSTEKDGKSHEREFLFDGNGDAGKIHSLIFLKGYQWPFDVKKYPDGSSWIDMKVYEETVLKGRRVFLDFRTASAHAPAMDALSPEAKEYLSRSGACSGTPLERLSKMNPSAIELYREHGIDLAKEPLEIALCAQHNNGGLAGDRFWQSENVPHLFPIGEVNGSHGICRPGGSALNAGQVGAFRASEYIFHCCQKPTLDMEKAEREAERLLRDVERRLKGSRSWRTDRQNLQKRMTECAGHLRNIAKLRAAVSEAEQMVKEVTLQGYRSDDSPRQCLINFHLVPAHFVYLKSILFQAESGAGSRGSAAITDERGRFLPEDLSFRKKVLETVLDNGTVTSRFVPVRPLPETDGWFENVWREFREGRIYENASL
ncbi:MAG: FAD-binding protein [Lentisphaeria bacterium]|nr:FAD-binding protein [Lentisphaeria bacterium]